MADPTTYDTDRGEGGETHQHVPSDGSHPAQAHLTTNHGVRISDNQNSLKSGNRGPSLLEDFVLREKIFHFDHERIPERIVHARGSAAHGYFELTESLTDVTKADVFSACRGQGSGFRPLLDRCRRRWLCRYPSRRSRLRRQILHAGRQLGSGRQQHSGLLYPGCNQVSRSHSLGENGS